MWGIFISNVMSEAEVKNFKRAYEIFPSLLGQINWGKQWNRILYIQCQR